MKKHLTCCLLGYQSANLQAVLAYESLEKLHKLINFQRYCNKCFVTPTYEAIYEQTVTEIIKLIMDSKCDFTDFQNKFCNLCCCHVNIEWRNYQLTFYLICCMNILLQ